MTTETQSIQPSPIQPLQSTKNGQAQGDDKTTDKMHRLLTVPLDQIEFDEGFNARLGDDSYGDIEALASTLEAQGQINPITVIANKQNSKQPYFAGNGFRRGRAFKMLHDKARAKDKNAPAPMVDVKLVQLEGNGFDERLIELRYLNLATDVGAKPLRDFEIASRCHYFESKLGAKPAFIAKQVGLSQQKVYVLLKLMRDLTPEVKKTWSAAPDASKEIPTQKLQSWAKRTPTEQKALLERHVAGDDGPVYEGGSTDADEAEKKGKKRIDATRPGMKDIKAEIERLAVKMESGDYKGADLARIEGASKALRYVTGDISRIF